jgi:hypothetical protein
MLEIGLAYASGMGQLKEVKNQTLFAPFTQS